MQRQILSKFNKNLLTIEDARIKTDNLLYSRAINSRETSLIYEGLFLRSYTNLEYFIENLFTLILMGKTTYAKKYVKPRVIISSSAILHDILHQGQDYIEWLPYSKTLNRANSLLTKGRPFTVLKPEHVAKIQESTRIRNCIAHTSKHSKKIFLEKVVGSTPLLPHQRTPSGFLRSSLRINPSLSRFKAYLINFNEIATALTQKS
jgi:hypothetical protein